MLNQKRQNTISCQEVRLLMVPMWSGAFDDADGEGQEFESHLAICQVCAKEYEKTKRFMSFVKKYWGPVNTETKQLLEHAGYKVVEQNHVSTHHKRPMTIKEGWKDLCKRCPELEENTEKSKSLQLFLRIGTVAACLLIGILTWMVFSNYSKQQTLSQNILSPQVATAPEPFVKIELVKPTGNITIDTGQAIVADGEFKTLLINGKHQMTMNTGTVLTIKPTVKQSNIGCLVRLDSGRIYTHVQHDGNPFIVDTTNGQAVITGTTFDIKATKDSTTLVVTEGTVRFENENGSVNVKAGQKSMLTANTKPTLPAICDAKMLTGWATGYKGTPDLAIAKSLSSVESEYKWPWPVEREPTALSEVDYRHWSEEKQSWFMSEFPWIFQLQKALAREGIKVDYHELLIQSDDLWQFSYLQNRSGHFSILSFDSLLKAASYYGFDKQWLLENVTAAKYAFVNSTLPDESFDLLNTFEQWDNIFEISQQSPSTVDYDILEHLFRASIYTVNTRSLMWFAVKNDCYTLTNKERTEVLALLQKQVNAATICQENALYQPSKAKQLCDSSLWLQDKWYEWTLVVSKNMEEITSTEDKIDKYETYKK